MFREFFTAPASRPPSALAWFVAGQDSWVPHP